MTRAREYSQLEIRVKALEDGTSGGGTGAVTQIVSGAGIAVNPSSGVGDVTVASTGVNLPFVDTTGTNKPIHLNP